ncbi:MAG: hypothetical protein ACI4G0_06050 [Ruminococcus sp.]
MLIVFGFIAFICVLFGLYEFRQISFCKRVEAVIVTGQYGFWENYAVRFPVYEYIWNNEVLQYVSRFSDDALEKTKVTLYIDRDGKPHELKSVTIPIVCGAVLGLMVILKASC